MRLGMAADFIIMISGFEQPPSRSRFGGPREVTPINRKQAEETEISDFIPVIFVCSCQVLLFFIALILLVKSRAASRETARRCLAYRRRTGSITAPPKSPQALQPGAELNSAACA